MNASDILAAVSAGEDKDLEFKSTKGGRPGSLWETYSAMANTDGGVIVLGVKEHDGDFEVQGLDDAPKTEKDFWATINNRGKVNANLLAPEDVRIVAVNGKSVLTVKVPRATRGQRPVFVGLNPLEGTYRRYGDGDYHCSREEVVLSNQRLQRFCTDHTTDITRMLQNLVAKGLLEKDGYGRWASYRLPGPLAKSRPTERATPDTTAWDSGPNGARSEHNQASSQQNEEGSQHNDPVLGETDLLELAAMARQKARIAPSRMRDIIRRLREGRFLSFTQIGSLVNRHLQGIRNRFLAEMVKSGELIPRFPENPTHSQQAYQTNPARRGP